MRIKLFLEQAFLLQKNLMAQDGSWKKPTEIKIFIKDFEIPLNSPSVFILKEMTRNGVSSVRQFITLILESRYLY